MRLCFYEEGPAPLPEPSVEILPADLSLRGDSTYLTPEELAELNRLVLARTRFKGDRPYEVKNWGDLRRVVNMTGNFTGDDYQQATFLCCAIVAHHPFADGNHRTSFYAGVMHLFLRGHFYDAPISDERALYDWRFEYEEAHALEAEWTHKMGGWDDPKGAERYLREFVTTEYGATIERFYRAHCREADIAAFLAAQHPGFFTAMIHRYPRATQKAARRIRRAKASRLRKTWKELEKQLMRPRALPPRQERWREDR